MKYELVRKGLILGIIVLFIVGGLTSNIGADSTGSLIMGKTWYIDDDATYPGSGSVGDPFKYIWQGIENATSGDDLSIASGEYLECIIIKDDINIKWHGGDILGSDTGQPIINGENKSSVIEIHATGVEIIEMNIVASRSTANNAGVYIEEGVKNVVIDSCVISDCYFGIWSHRTKPDEIFHTYRDNNISNIVDSGILASFSDELRILNNEISDCDYCGILLLDCENCVVQDNICENNQHGICIHIGKKNEIIENTCKNNYKWGFYIVGGLSNTIKGNNFMENGEKGQATFVEYCFFNGNIWTNNYWGKTSFIIHIIRGVLRLACCDIPWPRITYFPSSIPN